jgi:hypothetical protein
LCLIRFGVGRSERTFDHLSCLKRSFGKDFSILESLSPSHSPCSGESNEAGPLRILDPFLMQVYLVREASFFRKILKDGTTLLLCVCVGAGKDG